jgi:hypothetical protein
VRASKVRVDKGSDIGIYAVVVDGTTLYGYTNDCLNDEVRFVQ